MVDDAKIVVEADVGDFLHLPEAGGRDGTSKPPVRMDGTTCLYPEPPQSVDKLV